MKQFSHAFFDVLSNHLLGANDEITQRFVSGQKSKL
jgi:hypothetical protein